MSLGLKQHHKLFSITPLKNIRCKKSMFRNRITNRLEIDDKNLYTKRRKIGNKFFQVCNCCNSHLTNVHESYSILDGRIRLCKYCYDELK